jgi:hypothetical protein
MQSSSDFSLQGFGYNETARRNYAYDPDYAQYRLKKEFESHWTPIAPKS